MNEPQVIGFSWEHKEADPFLDDLIEAITVAMDKPVRETPVVLLPRWAYNQIKVVPYG